MRSRSADRVAVLVEASHREVSVVEVHPHHRPARPNLVSPGSATQTTSEVVGGQAQAAVR